MRIELTALAWKAKVLPLYDIRLLTKTGAENRVRTDDIYLGKVMLYQLSYFRLTLCRPTRTRTLTNDFGGRCAAITLLACNLTFWRHRQESNLHKTDLQSVP